MRSQKACRFETDGDQPSVGRTVTGQSPGRWQGEMVSESSSFEYVNDKSESSEITMSCDMVRVAEGTECNIQLRQKKKDLDESRCKFIRVRGLKKRTKR
jgi:hypothetical protein